MVTAYLVVWQVPPSAAEKILGGKARVVDAGIYATISPSPAPCEGAVPTLGATDTGEDFGDARLRLHLSLLAQVPELKTVIMQFPTYRKQVEQHALLGRARSAVASGEIFS